jgi:hypothetical protein
MKKKIAIMLVCLLASILPGACSSTGQPVEVTRVVPQTVVVTQLVQVMITPTSLATDTRVPPTPLPAPTNTPRPTPVLDMSSQDGRVVVTQYYTLMGLHLYEQAYQMFSSKMRPPVEFKSFLNISESAYKVLKIFEVIPALEEIKRVGGNPSGNIADWYYVTFYAEGENGMSGSQANGIQHRYVLLTKEKGEWKILEFGDSYH